MDENTIVSQLEHSAVQTQPRALKSIVYAGLAVGVLDGLAASINAGFRGTSPVRVFQYIASGLLGRESFDGGYVTAAIGLLLHFTVAFGAAAVFVTASRFLPILTRMPFVFGPIYGIVVYLVMREIVSPLSLVSRLPSTVSGLMTMIIIHIVCVGLPIALVTSKFAKTNNSYE